MGLFGRKKEKKPCAYEGCDQEAKNECKICYKPICKKHTKKLASEAGLRWQVCADCYLERKGKIKRTRS